MLRARSTVMPVLALVALLGGVLIASSAGQEDPLPVADPAEQVARDYMALYAAGRIDELGELMADDIRIEDPTSNIAGEPMRLEGREAVIGRLRELFRGVQDTAIVIEKSFFSGQHGVFWGRFTYSVPLGPGRFHPVTMDIVTILQVVEGKVVDHVDHADYASVQRQVKQAMEDGGR